MDPFSEPLSCSIQQWNRERERDNFPCNSWWVTLREIDVMWILNKILILFPSQFFSSPHFYPCVRRSFRQFKVSPMARLFPVFSVKNEAGEVEHFLPSPFLPPPRSAFHFIHEFIHVHSYIRSKQSRATCKYENNRGHEVCALESSRSLTHPNPWPLFTERCLGCLFIRLFNPNDEPLSLTFPVDYDILLGKWSSLRLRLSFRALGSIERKSVVIEKVKGNVFPYWIDETESLPRTCSRLWYWLTESD